MLITQYRASCMELSENFEIIYAPSTPVDDRIFGSNPRGDKRLCELGSLYVL